MNVLVLDAVLASDGFVAYRSNTGVGGVNSPKIRYWNNTANSGNGSWSNETELASTGSPIRTLVLKQSPIDSKIVLVTLSDDGNLSGYVCMKYCDNASYWNYTFDVGSVWSFGLPAIQRRFDLSFETATGDLLLVYAVNDSNVARDLGYKVLPDNSTSFQGLTEQYINDPLHANNIQYSWVAMDSNPLNNSEEIIMSAFDLTDTDINAWVWNGNGFVMNISLTDAATATLNREAFAVKYTSDGSKGMVAAGDQAVGNLTSDYWNGTAWNGVTGYDINTSAGNNNDVNWLTMKADPSSDHLQMVIEDSGSDLYTSFWNGTGWNQTYFIDAGLDAVATRTADFSWLYDGSGRVIWDTDGAAGNTLSVRTCNPQCNTSTQTFSIYGGTGAWITLFTNPTATDLAKFLGFRLNNTFDIAPFRYNGTYLNYTNYGNITSDTIISTN